MNSNIMRPEHAESATDQVGVPAGAPAGNWQQYAKEGETAQDVIERERRDNDALCTLLAKERAARGAREPVPPQRKTLSMTDEQMDAWIREADVHGAWKAPFAQGVRWAICRYEAELNKEQR